MSNPKIPGATTSRCVFRACMPTNAAVETGNIFENRCAFIFGVIVNNYQLPVGVVLADYRVYGFAEKTTFVFIWNNYAYQRAIH